MGMGQVSQVTHDLASWWGNSTSSQLWLRDDLGYLGSIAKFQPGEKPLQLAIEIGKHEEWRFPWIGVPLNHPFIDGFSINHPALGVVPFIWKHPGFEYGLYPYYIPCLMLQTPQNNPKWCLNLIKRPSNHYIYILCSMIFLVKSWVWYWLVIYLHI